MILDMRCRNCRHWNRPGSAGAGTCDQIKFNVSETGRSPSKAELPAASEAAIQVNYAPDYATDAMLYTGPDFGCVMFEKE